ncbi:threonine aspartase 1 isoform X2 [Agrilus planipennis]|uniref:Threonine aspartase 1 isoform X2 n=1 Tax=Agrilus planipennis TaxID=224129 RepID=A0A1W4WWM6_AGRPL|nr:threonine aspartase 1 isoform X2 [Agrilus planipennis]
MNDTLENMSGVIAVHCGAGYHSEKIRRQYNKLSRQACRASAKILNDGGTSLEAVKAAITVLENNSLTNAGKGSNLTIDGYVECDAAIMNGRTLLYGGCGAIQKVKNPIELAYEICCKQTQKLPLGLIPPTFLVGNGALKYAKNVGIKTVPKKYLMSQSSFKRMKKYKALLEQKTAVEYKDLMDTVGAVCVDKDGHVASGCSSGGLILKKPGRVGQGALYACGVWADSFNSTSENSVAVSTTGCGEYLIRTQLAKEIAKDIKHAACPVTTLHKSMIENFIDSRFLWDVSEKLGGALVLHVKPSKEGHVMWGHSTETMSVGFLNCNDGKAKSVVSKLPMEVSVGSSVSVNGIDFTL